MPKYAITRTWSVAGWVTTEVEADSEDVALQIEAENWDTVGAVASLPPALRRHIESIEDEIDDVSVLPRAGG